MSVRLVIGITRTEMVRRAFAVLKAYREQIELGRTHLGFAREADRLEVELVGVLTAVAKVPA